MPAVPTAPRYSAPAIAFHWAIALLLLANLALGLLFEGMDRGVRPWWINLHGVTGSLVFVLALGRLGWRLRHPPPPPVPDARWALALAAFAHGALYVLMFVLPVTGLVTWWLRGRGLDFGLFALPSPLAADRPLAGRAETLHAALAWATMAVASLHVAAALFHAIVRRDGVLSRMLPLARSRP